WVLREACRVARRWNDRYGLPVGVNVSARQLSNGGFAELVLDTLAETGLPSSALVLELTETSVIESSSDLGVRAQLTGYGIGASGSPSTTLALDIRHCRTWRNSRSILLRSTVHSSRIRRARWRRTKARFSSEPSSN